MIDQIIAYIKKGKFSNNLIFEKEIKEKSGEFEDINFISNPLFQSALKELGINRLYSHQKTAYDLIKSGKNVLITTPTASGKTLCYNLPILEDIYENGCSALYLFPIKALGYDQKEKLTNFAEKIPMFDFNAHIIDGDTDKKLRRKILKSSPDVVISNIDILHFSILPKLNEWEPFLNRLKYIVVDELHVYRGIFGSHVKQIIGRFKRFFPHVQFIASSATISNPLELANTIFESDFELVNNNGAPSPKKNFLLFNPEDLPSSAIATYLLKILLESGKKFICFTKSRVQTETIYRKLISDKRITKNDISSYRAGFLPEERRIIEQNFKEEKIKGVIATSAFELGIDIGGVDVTVIIGFPGSLMSLWQRAGRGGRTNKQSLIIFIASNDALDQYYVKNPEKLFSSDLEEAVVDVENSVILKQHIQCAAFEKFIDTKEDYYKKNKLIIDEMLLENSLFKTEDNTKIVTLKNYPHKEVDIRGSGDSYTIMAHGIIIGTNSSKKVYTENYLGAIYLHRGETFIVEKIDHSKKEVHVKPANPNYYTRPIIEKQTEILEIIKSKSVKNSKVSYAKLKVIEHLKGFEKISEKTGEKIGKTELNTEPISFETKGVILEIPDFFENKNRIMGSIHAVEHAILGIVPTSILCDRNDIGGISYPNHPQTGSISIFLYDGFPGGIGIASRIYEKIEKILNNTLKNVKECGCESGCPACIISPKCGSGNYPLDKAGAIDTLSFILNNKSNFFDKKEISKEDIIIFDIETKYSAEDVGGWHNADKMEVAILVAYSYLKDEYLIYDENTLEEFFNLLNSAKAVIGFNIINFDFKVLSKYRQINYKSFLVLDILLDIKRITGKRFSLNNIANATLGTKKTANGLESLKWFKEGKIDKIIEYCKKDVEITKQIFEFGIKNNKIFSNNKEMKISIPVSWKHLKLPMKTKD